MASSRKSLSFSGHSFQARKKTSETGGGGASDLPRRSLTSSRSSIGERSGERTVKRLRLCKALTVPDTTTLYEACRRMAARRVDALLLTDSNALLCGILTDRDIATKVIAKELNLEETPVSKVMTKNPVFVLSDTIAVEALQKMVQGKFRHLPVVENGEVIALLDIAKCLYDAIARMERSVEKGKAIAAAVEGVEKNWGTSIAGPNTFMETLRERIFKPSLSTIIPENTKVLKVGLDETVLRVTVKMVEYQSSSAMVMLENKLVGILTSKDILMRVIAQNLPPETTTVEKVMTQNPESATVDMAIVDALHIMHNGKFLHLPVLDKETQSLTTLITAILQRMGDDIDPDNLPQIMYEDNDKVILASDGDLGAAVEHAKSIGWKILDMARCLDQRAAWIRRLHQVRMLLKIRTLYQIRTL